MADAASRQPPHAADNTAIEALQLTVTGRVQGVGFRPFVYRLAQANHLRGWVRNGSGDVEIHVEGNNRALKTFTRHLFQHAPPLSQPVLADCRPTGVDRLEQFSIRDSHAAGPAHVHVPPDLFVCNECLAELHDPGDRRYRYPFINCTQCGPRYTLMHGMPYDRAATTMAGFELCEACAREYRDPMNRRFHAEPVACPDCGPALRFRAADGTEHHGNAAALAACQAALQQGRVVAVKGIGGYHLMCAAHNDIAIAHLRRNKPRAHKPLAVMFPFEPACPLQSVNQHVWLCADQARLLQSPQRPIVLARKRPASDLSGLLAPGLDELGVMLPYSPLHHLLLADFGAPLVATSANISGEPVLTDDADVEARLAHVADAFLHHDRPIARPADDPVYRVIHNQPRPLRLGRGSAPLEQTLPVEVDAPLLAVGGHMKCSIALAWKDRLVVSPHIGDMGSARSLAVFEQTLHDLQALYGVTASRILCDAHPGYATSRWALQSGMAVTRIFHHRAHAAAATPPGDIQTPRLVFTWDGVGYGEDDTLWGGEALLGRPGDWRRFASLRPFHLPGGERAGREPWRSALALCWESGQDWAAAPAVDPLLQQAWERRINTPPTSAAGRLFDAAAALTGLCSEASFEGQGPMLLEAACHGRGAAVTLPLERAGDGVWRGDWAPLLPVLQDKRLGVAQRAGMFHASLAQLLLSQARLARAEHDVNAVSLAGGVFQNRVLTEHACELLREDGFEVWMPEDIPVNDGGLCVGQVMEYALRQQRAGEQ